VCHKIVLEKDPGAPNLCARNPSDLGALTELLWVEAKEECSLGQAERTLSIACALGGQVSTDKRSARELSSFPMGRTSRGGGTVGLPKLDSPKYSPARLPDKIGAILFVPAGSAQTEMLPRRERSNRPRQRPRTEIALLGGYSISPRNFN